MGRRRHLRLGLDGGHRKLRAHPSRFVNTAKVVDCYATAGSLSGVRSSRRPN